MSLGDSPEDEVSYDLATLTFGEALRAHLCSRRPHARRPIIRGIASALGLILGSALIGSGIAMGSRTRINVASWALGFGIIGAIVPTLRLHRVQAALGRLRRQGICTTKISREGVFSRTDSVECLYRWSPGQQFTAQGDDVLLMLRPNGMVWLPRRAFDSDDAVEAFLRSARGCHADAMRRTVE
jgi:hypothetical protein